MALVLVDTNVLLLLIVGNANRGYVSIHKRLKDDYSESDFDLLVEMISQYDGVITTPHILAEVSSLSKMIGPPARDHVRRALAEFVALSEERPVSSLLGCQHPAFTQLGLTDSVILTACETGNVEGEQVELLTADQPVYNRARSSGLPAELFD